MVLHLFGSEKGCTVCCIYAGICSARITWLLCSTIKKCIRMPFCGWRGPWKQTCAMSAITMCQTSAFSTNYSAKVCTNLECANSSIGAPTVDKNAGCGTGSETEAIANFAIELPELLIFLAPGQTRDVLCKVHWQMWETLCFVSVTSSFQRYKRTVGVLKYGSTFRT